MTTDESQHKSAVVMEMNGAMAVGATWYADALEELRRFGPAVFTRNRGMCAALEVTLSAATS